MQILQHQLLINRVMIQMSRYGIEEILFTRRYLPINENHMCYKSGDVCFFTLSIFLITWVTPVSDIQCLAGCDGFKQRREEFHSLQALVLVKPNYWL